MDFTALIDLASERLGGAVLAANDEFFAPKENLLKTAKPVFIEDKYTDAGKWMDGWETRRRRSPGHDWCVIRLGLPGVVRGVVVDTSHFKGNYPEHCSIDACAIDGHPEVAQLTGASAPWIEILPKLPLNGDSQNPFAITNPHRITHLRLNIYPDGGVARLGVYGEVIPEAQKLHGTVDLAALENGAVALECSDMFFGNPSNLIMPGSAARMSDGWETRRRRGPGHDWVVIRLAASGTIENVEVDTSHFKGNCPGTCSIETRDGDGPWGEALAPTPLQPHTRHVFEEELQINTAATHLRFNIFPDGGVARLRVYGKLSTEGEEETGLRRLNTLFPEAAEVRLRNCCASSKWVRVMNAQRPFDDADQLIEHADRIWQDCRKEDWLEAFRGHPQIGEQAPGMWSRQEQAGVNLAAQETLEELAEANRAYEKKFGHIFIVSASGKTADEMLTLLKARLPNDPEMELRVAAEEQHSILRLRLEKLLRS